MNHWIDTTGTLDLWQVGIAYLVLAGSLSSLAFALWDSLAGWTPRQLSDSRWQPHRTAVLAVVVVLGAAGLRLALDGRIATVFIGYKATQQALDLFPVAHYGAGASVLYHQLLALFGADHRVILVANAVMGSLTLPLVMSWVRRTTGRPIVALVVGLLVAVAPLFVRNDCSDANNVPCLLALFTGLSLLARAAEERTLWWVWWAGFPLTLAAVSRPEMIVLAFGLVLVTAAAFPSGIGNLWWRGGLLLTAFAALTVPHFIHITRAADAMRQGGNMESVTRMFAFKHNILFEPTLFGAGYTAAAVLGSVALWRHYRRWMLGLWAVAIVGMMIYAVDLDRANLARTLVPAALVATILAGHGVVALGELVGRGAGPLVAAGMLVLALASNLWPAKTLWHPTNEDQEEALIRQALESIEEPNFTLLRLNHPDPDPARLSGAGHTHYHFPDYLVMTPERRGRVLPLSTWLQSPDSEPGTVYFLRSFRCYATFRRDNDVRPTGRNEHPLCQELVNRPGTVPLFETEAPNHGDVWINYYGDAETLTVGLYRLKTR